jgi:hypothetical protein
MRVRANREMRYMTRMLRAGDEFEATPVDAKFLLGEQDPSVDVVDDEPSRRVRLQREAEPSQETKADSLESMSAPELRQLAEERGIDLPSGYVTKPKLLSLLRGESPGEEDLG